MINPGFEQFETGVLLFQQKMRAESPYHFNPMAERSVALGLKCSKPVSRVLCLLSQVFAIYLDLMSPPGSSSLPPGIGRAVLHAPVYMTLQLPSGTASDIAAGSGELLPHLLTLTPQNGAVIFFYLTLLSRIATR